MPDTATQHPPKPADVGLSPTNEPAVGLGDDRYADRPAASSGEPGIGDLIRTLRDESLHLVRQEVNLAKTEVREKADFFAGQATKLGVGLGVLAVGALGLLSAAAFLIGGLIDAIPGVPLNASAANGIGFLIVGAIAAIAGYSMYKAARARIAAEPVAPQHTLQSLKDDKQWNTNTAARPSTTPSQPRRA